MGFEVLANRVPREHDLARGREAIEGSDRIGRPIGEEDGRVAGEAGGDGEVEGRGVDQGGTGRGGTIGE